MSTDELRRLWENLEDTSEKVDEIAKTQAESGVMIRVMGNIQVEMKAKLDALHDKFLAVSVCSAPNSCLALSKRVEEHGKKLEEIEAWRNKALGLIAGLMVLIGIFGNDIRNGIGRLFN